MKWLQHSTIKVPTVLKVVSRDRLILIRTDIINGKELET